MVTFGREDFFKMPPSKQNYQRVVNAKSHVFSYTIKSGKRIPTRLTSAIYVFYLRKEITVCPPVKSLK